MLARLATALALVTLVALPGCPTPNRSSKQPVPPGGPDVAFDINEGGIHNYFYRRGPISAHVLASSGENPRLIVAFPAGNTGIALWFEKTAKVVKFDLTPGAVDGVERTGGMRGVQGTVAADIERLDLKFSVLGSIRTVRDYPYTGTKPPETEHQVTRDGDKVVLRRTMADGKHHAELELVPKNGTTIQTDGGKLSISAAPGKAIELSFVALADDTPLTPIPIDQLLTSPAPASAQRDLSALAFLSYQEKLLAGSWRFDTYFGRDTLMTVRLMMNALRPEVVEAGLGAVIERLAPDGDVAHEEDIGDFATLRHAKEGGKPGDASPIYDYKMVDDDLLLAPVLAAYLDSAAGKDRAAAFLSRKTTSGQTFAQALKTNLALVVRKATPFADKPVATNLVSIHDGITVGQWRDSQIGLGYGKYAFDVNVALVPAALDAAARLYERPELGGDATAAATARKLAKAWGGAEALFRVELGKDDAIAKVKTYAAAQGIDGATPAASITGPVVFDALSLDAAGKPIPVMNTDDGFVLLFGAPAPAYLDQVAERLVRPFPAGLRTPVGMVVANAAFVTDPAVQGLFTREQYHGAVVWSWQQALLAVGLERQIARPELPAATRAKLVEAQTALWQVIDAMASQRTGELWTWTVQGGKIVHEAFGQDASHADESNAAQLWSTVYLGVHAPAATR